LEFNVPFQHKYGYIRDDVLDGVPAPRKRGTPAPPLFSPCLLWSGSPVSPAAELLFD